MHSIDASSKKIVDIIRVIDGIALLTNILALNAVVETAAAAQSLQQQADNLARIVNIFKFGNELAVITTPHRMVDILADPVRLN